MKRVREVELGANYGAVGKFLIRLGDLPDAITNKIVAETRNYTVLIIINDIPLGSGTFIDIDGHQGLLTAEHVARVPQRPELHLDNTSHNGPKLSIPPAEFPGGKPVDSFALRVFSTQRKSDSYGPDLVFIELPESELLWELRARRSFYPLTKDVDIKVSESLQDNGFVAFCGFPASQRTEQAPSLGYTEVISSRGFAFMTGPEKYEVRDSWDYFELGVDRSEVEDIGNSFGGVSGGGIWKIPVFRKEGEPMGNEYFEKMTYAGIAFYEENHLPNGRFFIRAHGPKSIYENFLPNVRDELRARR